MLWPGYVSMRDKKVLRMQEQDISFIPSPREWNIVSANVFRLSTSLRYQNEDFPDVCLQAFAKRLDLINLEADSNNPQLIIQEKENLSQEEYYLLVESNLITIQASSERGVILGLSSLYLLIQEDKIPCVEIKDSPRFAHRGLSLDCARTFFSVDEVKKIIDNLSLIKMNVLHWHLSDDQAWRIESKILPKLNSVSEEYYTHQEIKDVISYAQVRGIDIIPEIDVPGHTRAILEAYPELSCTGQKVSSAKTAGIFSEIFCASQEHVFSFIEQLFEEITSLFPSKYFHFGSDEVPTWQWQKCPHCQALMREKSYDTPRMLQAYFAQRVHDILDKFGKQSIAWNDLLLAGAPENTTIQYWTVNHARSMNQYAYSGKPYIYSNMFRYYFDYPHSMSPLKRVFEHKPNIYGRECAQDTGFKGIEACVWCEYIDDDEQLENQLFPRMYAVAETAWANPNYSYPEFLRRIEKNLEASLKTGLTPAPRTSWDPKGKARRRNAIAYFRKMNTSQDPKTKRETWRNSRPSRKFILSFYRKFYKPWDLFQVLFAMRD